MWLILLAVFSVSIFAAANIASDDLGQLVSFIICFVGLTVLAGFIGLFDVAGDWTLIEFYKTFFGN